ncbi:hypothetical protein ACCO45_009757 [Purpureocillium lilacinum]|uniref:Uncharacterized protein n=1 Tax=Purpureocillium lilacinum TaxID=33203 RepID=A0ACC4DKK4_PURLI
MRAVLGRPHLGAHWSAIACKPVSRNCLDAAGGTAATNCPRLRAHCAFARRRGEAMDNVIREGSLRQRLREGQRTRAGGHGGHAAGGAVAAAAGRTKRRGAWET